MAGIIRDFSDEIPMEYAFDGRACSVKSGWYSLRSCKLQVKSICDNAFECEGGRGSLFRVVARSSIEMYFFLILTGVDECLCNEDSNGCNERLAYLL